MVMKVRLEEILKNCLVNWRPLDKVGEPVDLLHRFVQKVLIEHEQRGTIGRIV